jgi:hypothetical protein
MDWSQFAATSSSLASVSSAVSPAAIQPGNSRISPRKVPSVSGTTRWEYGRFKYSAGVILLLSGLVIRFIVFFIVPLDFLFECFFPPKNVLLHQIDQGPLDARGYVPSAAMIRNCERKQVREELAFPHQVCATLAVCPSSEELGYSLKCERLVAAMAQRCVLLYPVSHQKRKSRHAPLAIARPPLSRAAASKPLMKRPSGGCIGVARALPVNYARYSSSGLNPPD